MSDIEVIVQEATAALAAAADLNALDDLRVRYLGKKGAITALLKSLGGLPAEQRPAAGQAINDAKQRVSDQLDARKAALEAAHLDERLRTEHIDVTLPGRGTVSGAVHPISIVIERIEGICRHAGFEVARGPEVEDDFHNFEA